MTRSFRSQPTTNASARLRRAQRKQGTTPGVARNNRSEADRHMIDDSYSAFASCWNHCPDDDCDCDEN